MTRKEKRAAAEQKRRKLMGEWADKLLQMVGDGHAPKAAVEAVNRDIAAKIRCRPQDRSLIVKAAKEFEQRFKRSLEQSCSVKCSEEAPAAS